MQCYKISINNSKRIFDNLGCDKIGNKLLCKKVDIHTLFIKDLHFGAANILKQDALSIGADLAVPSGVIIGKEKYVDVILIGNTKHFEILSKKELTQPFGLKLIAKELKSFINFKQFDTKIMGVINANEDSFYQESRFNNTNVVEKIQDMITDGANIIDIGGVSSRPGSVTVKEEVELSRIKPICDLIYQEKLNDKVIFSIDSYSPLVIDYALSKGFKIVNDITGLRNEKVAKVTSKYDASLVIMHMQNNPMQMQNNPTYSDVMTEISDFFSSQINVASKYGIKDIILDVGIGFGKNLKHNITLISKVSLFHSLGFPILLGMSRKKFIKDISGKNDSKQRLGGTIGSALFSLMQGVQILRVHDVNEVIQSIKIFKELLKS